MAQPTPVPRLVAWEVTRACGLACLHCRAEAQPGPHADELTHDEGLRLLDEIAGTGRPIVILTGGDPLLRADIYELAAYGTSKGLRMVASPCGTSLTPDVVHKLQKAGVARVSISVDGSSPAVHDAFRGTPGAFEATVEGLGYCREAGLPFQINTTITRRNIDDLPAMLELALSTGAVGWHPFMLVPTGRGKLIEREEVSPEQYENALRWLEGVADKYPLQIKPTCAPHFVRIARQLNQGHLPQHHRPGTQSHGHGLHAVTRGCMAGNGFCFVSHVGEVHGCGFLPVSAGSVRERPFPEIYEESPLFQELRDFKRLGGKCGVCEYKVVCGGCRARALAATGDYLGEEPFCAYE
ncbi:MAG: TIGR04053 family radical SAM/SPASM domain-containing protein, partial [Chloroflexota bacterium]